jgi:hypothetical protein
MNTYTMLAAGGSGDLLVGLLIGCCLGILVGPAFRAWQIHREWMAASREAGLADQLLDRMEHGADLEDWTAFTDADEPIGEPAWRTHH